MSKADYIINSMIYAENTIPVYDTQNTLDLCDICSDYCDYCDHCDFCDCDGNFDW